MSWKEEQLRIDLKRLGYDHYSSLKSAALVGDLVKELIKSKDQILRFREIADTALKRNNDLEKAFASIRDENDYLRNLNSLWHCKLLGNKEVIEKQLKVMKSRFMDLEKAYSDLEFTNIDLMSKIVALEELILTKTEYFWGAKEMKRSSYSKSLHKTDSNQPKILPPPSSTLGSVNNFITDILSQVNPQKTLSDSVEDLKFKRKKLLDSIKLHRKELYEYNKHLEEFTQMNQNDMKCSSAMLPNACDCHSGGGGLNCGNVFVASCKENAVDKDWPDLRENAFPNPKENAFCTKTDISYHKKEKDHDVLNVERVNFAVNQNSEKSASDSSKNKGVEKSTQVAFIPKPVSSRDVQTQNHEEWTSNQECSRDKISLVNPEQKPFHSDKLTSCSRGTQCINVESPPCNLNNLKIEILREVESLCKELLLPRDNLFKPASCSKATQSIITDSPPPCNLSNLKNEILKEVESFCKELLSPKAKSVKPTTFTSIGTQSMNINPPPTPPFNLNTLKNEIMKEVESFCKQLLLSRDNSFRSLPKGICNGECFRKLDNSKQDLLRLLDSERRKYQSELQDAANRANHLESLIDSLNRRLEDMASESSCLEFEYSKLRSVNEHLERSLRTADASFQKCELELSEALRQLKISDQEKKELSSSLQSSKKEIEVLNGRIYTLVKEKDSILEKLDSNTVELKKLEKKCRSQLCMINQLEEKISSYHCKFTRHADDESGLRYQLTEKTKELEGCKEVIGKLRCENGRLRSDLDSLVKDHEFKLSENKLFQKEIVKLKEQLQNYVEEVRKVEEILEVKEREREQLLDHFKSLNMEASNLENNFHILENEKECSQSKLREAEGRVVELQESVTNKDSFLTRLEQQINEMSNELFILKSELTAVHEENYQLKDEVESSKNLINYLTDEKSRGDLEDKEVQTPVVSTGLGGGRCVRDIASDSQRKVDELQSTLDQLQNQLASMSGSIERYQETVREENSQAENHGLGEPRDQSLSTML